MSGYPIQLGKVQRPPLRDETLARARLLEWLDVKVHNRVVFVIADAGYGKTTLLADFSRRTRLRTLWYRMDDEDRSWVSFLSYLVAAGRVFDPEFAPRTHAMLEETGPGGASRDEVAEAFLREMPSIAKDGAVLVLDDFHVADDVPDIRQIAKQLVERAPERLTLIFSTRRPPPVPVARLRAMGELAELRTSDLRFSEGETGELFEETYHRHLEPDVLSDLSRRTEGWAASLYLVQAALRDRSSRDTRAFIRQLSGAHAELHDYLAEEVVGDLPAEHQQFLMLTSILQTVDADAAMTATGLSLQTATTLIAASERLGLLADRSRGSEAGHAYHPLVREFLEARLRKELGEAAVLDLHRRLGMWAESRDWIASCFHLAAAGDIDRLHQVIAASIEEIVGRGQIGIASTYLLTYPPASLLAEHEIVRSRSAGLTMDLDGTLFHAKQAVELDGGSDASVGNLLATYFLIGDQSDAPNLAMRLAAEAQTPILRRVGEATLHLMAASLDGNTEVAAAALSDLLDHSRRLGLQHYEAVALLDLSLVRRAQGDAPAALAFAREAVEILSTVAAGSEVVASQMALAWALAHLGRLNEARSVQATAAESCTTASRLEWLVEAAQIEVSYGDETTAQSLLNEARSMTWNSAFAACNQISRVELALRVGDLAAAEALIPSRLPVSPSVETGFRARCLVVAAYTAARLGREDGQQQLEEAMAFALGQGSGLWANYADSILAATADAVDVGVRRVATHGTEYFSIVAEVWIEQLARLDTTSMASIAAEAQRRPERWQASVRRCAADPTSPNRVRAARLLDMIGDRTDVPLLRSIGRTSRHSASDRSLGRGLARRLADRVMVEDQGRVEIIVGTQVIAGTALRRKVLALLCVLLSKPKYAATRDEVVDALWPDLAPEVALNSLNQTVYFLRRVFEPGYKEDSSAGYVNHDSDLLWLDDSLIRSRSRMCRELIDSLGPDPSPSAVGELSDTYKGRFSLDFSYEEWAVPYRDALHVGYLQAIEHAVNRDIESGHYERAIGVARRALEIDPNQESLELSLLRLYRLTGAHSAAAEQYAHYSTYLREELGVDAPPLASL